MSRKIRCNKCGWTGNEKDIKPEVGINWDMKWCPSCGIRLLDRHSRWSDKTPWALCMAVEVKS